VEIVGRQKTDSEKATTTPSLSALWNENQTGVKQLKGKGGAKKNKGVRMSTTAKSGKFGDQREKKNQRILAF